MVWNQIGVLAVKMPNLYYNSKNYVRPPTCSVHIRWKIGSCIVTMVTVFKSERAHAKICKRDTLIIGFVVITLWLVFIVCLKYYWLYLRLCWWLDIFWCDKNLLYNITKNTISFLPVTTAGFSTSISSLYYNSKNYLCLNDYNVCTTAHVQIK